MYMTPCAAGAGVINRALTKLKSQLPANIVFNYVVGGLAPDSEEPMPVEMQQKLESIWHTIQAQLRHRV